MAESFRSSGMIAPEWLVEYFDVVADRCQRQARISGQLKPVAAESLDQLVNRGLAKGVNGHAVQKVVDEPIGRHR